MSAMDRITVSRDVCGGRPCIRGLRIRVKDVLDLLASGSTQDDILADYPYLEPVSALRQGRINPKGCRDATEMWRVNVIHENSILAHHGNGHVIDPDRAVVEVRIEPDSDIPVKVTSQMRSRVEARLLLHGIPLLHFIGRPVRGR